MLDETMPLVIDMSKSMSKKGGLSIRRIGVQLDIINHDNTLYLISHFARVRNPYYSVRDAHYFVSA